ncbi:MAG: FAD-dependent oxidoreductase [marine benthic group bacterium]|nr:FAD-dependent oxidoreductase [Gemmatimonadota bacterium]
MSDATSPEAGGLGNDERRLTPAYRPSQVEKQAPCQAGCPNCGDIRGWIGTVAQRDKLGLTKEEAYERAWRMITDVNPFPSVLGRVCPHPCESHCNRAEHDEPLAINAMERFLGDWAIEADIPLPTIDGEAGPEWVGVVGAGPSGLSFAYQMARRGYRVTVYEGREKAGGMLRFGIPDYRLPPAVLDAEIEKIERLGVEIELETAVGRDVSLQELKQRHAALYLGIGAQAGRGLGVPGEDGPGVWTGTEFLSLVNCGEPVDPGTRVAVIGGGNTAIDAARAARRLGAEVTILYRRSRTEMPAIEHEIDDALEEGVELVLLASPVRLERQPNGDLATLVAQRMELGEPDDSGRRRPVPIPGSEFELPVSAVIAAVSQTPDIRGFEDLDQEGGWFLTGNGGAVGDGVWAGGDALGLGIAGMAIVQGRHAAEALHARFRGLAPPEAPENGKRLVGADEIIMEFHETRPPALPERLSPEERLAAPMAEVSGRITEEQFLAETSRCFSCGSCFGCSQCEMFCTSGCFTKLEEVGPGIYFTLTLEQCQECGKCVEVCPCGFLEVN